MDSIEATLRTFFQTLDRKDFASMLKMVVADVEGSDEISKKWLRGKKAFEAYIKRIGPEISDIKSRIYDVHTRRMGGVGLATFTMKQSYTLSGQPHTFNFVTSAALVKRGGTWKVSLIHMTPVGSA